MKKLIALLTVLLLTVALVGCVEKRDAKIPIDNPSYIAFYNGGEIVYEAFRENGVITLTAEKIATVTVALNEDVTEYWLVYSITQNGITTKIVDSDAMAIIWTD